MSFYSRDSCKYLAMGQKKCTETWGTQHECQGELPMRKIQWGHFPLWYELICYLNASAVAIVKSNMHRNEFRDAWYTIAGTHW